jgi:hypothetical protein
MARLARSDAPLPLASRHSGPLIASHLGPFSHSSVAFASGTGPPGSPERSILLITPILSFRALPSCNVQWKSLGCVSKLTVGDRNLYRSRFRRRSSVRNNTTLVDMRSRRAPLVTNCVVPTHRKPAIGLPPWGSTFWASPRSCAKI